MSDDRCRDLDSEINRKICYSELSRATLNHIKTAFVYIAMIKIASFETVFFFSQKVGYRTF